MGYRPWGPTVAKVLYHLINACAIYHFCQVTFSISLSRLFLHFERTSFGWMGVLYFQCH